MGFGKKWKRFSGSIGKSVSDLTGSEFAGRATSFVVGGGAGLGSRGRRSEGALS